MTNADILTKKTQQKLCNHTLFYIHIYRICMDCIYIGAYRTKNQIYLKKQYVWTLAVPSSSQDIPDNNYDFLHIFLVLIT